MRDKKSTGAGLFMLCASASLGQDLAPSPLPATVPSAMSPAEVRRTLSSACLPAPNRADRKMNDPVGRSSAKYSPQLVAPQQDVRDRVHLAETFVTERLAVWRQRLNLEDWKISVVMTRRNDLRPRTLATIRWDKANKSAVVWVLDASDYHGPVREMLDDMELSIVHELVHLELASLPRSEASRQSEEHAVNRIAEALLRLDRRD